MCLTIPKKVISVSGETVTVENADGSRQEFKTIVKLEIGDFCLTQQNVAIEKIDEDEANKSFEILKNLGG